MRFMFDGLRFIPVYINMNQLIAVSGFIHSNVASAYVANSISIYVGIIRRMANVIYASKYYRITGALQYIGNCDFAIV